MKHSFPLSEGKSLHVGCPKHFHNICLAESQHTISMNYRNAQKGVNVTIELP